MSGATRIVPVEAGPPETGTANPEATLADLAPRRGYQEYAIQQTPYEQPMKSSSAELAVVKEEGDGDWSISSVTDGVAGDIA
ncbi:hypothetical protein GH733_008155 [Mirounga leonina]|nr:hypothetical protein GH733_008155 [Mirounga leonina]